MAPISFSARALARKVKSRSFYFDLGAPRGLLGPPQVSPHDLRAARLRGARGARWWSKRKGSRRAGRGTSAIIGRSPPGSTRWASLLPPAGERLWTLNAVKVPDGVDEAAVRRRLLDEFNIEIGAGLGPLAGRIWRVGLMGAGSTLAERPALPDRARAGAVGAGLQDIVGHRCRDGGEGGGTRLAAVHACARCGVAERRAGARQATYNVTCAVARGCARPGESSRRSSPWGSRAPRTST